MDTSHPPKTLHARCCIVGGGPAGMMLGFLLARQGVDVIVLEKHADFLRDFRGDTIHPSTLEVMHELGLLDAFLARPHQETQTVSLVVGGETLTLGDFSHLPTRCKFVAFMPQWDFLDFLAEHARVYPHFRLRMQAEATDLIEEQGRVAGIRASTPDGPLDVRADLVIAADGRRSVMREKAGLEVLDIGAPMDVLWMRISRHPGDPSQLLGRVAAGRMLVMIDRGEYWQCAYLIPKGALERLKREGLPAFRAKLAGLAPFLGSRVEELRSWDDIKLLTVAVDRLNQWFKPGLLCIGDAAHAMSPVGGVGINLAIQDAVATANILGPQLRNGSVGPEALALVQKRREWPTRMTQRLQVLLQDRMITPVLGSKGPVSAPWIVRLLARWPLFRRLPARLIGMGFRPEHVR
ncbi:2-polyprenyl-6-methoxyphenol hydroxylase-like FAD-dependent oxidoreductase [Microvirga flocculans]|uniref:2-polyprenyl-6-methoxyphenol hydroxylase-like FAD-dependent oxidoreductase n=1 Tax=Microvirga flocculans TaxID=217168 RepID=A0A7W6N8R7_9HYPH|nr:FAD-dependent oxidoreductase [Microvirga flocculans]MBB4040997.1 2-polyprenyl-6-methoxyphenol hydroxylase-like FAD-dependent oxidoreductase [Microvirga flocculans]